MAEAVRLEETFAILSQSERSTINDRVSKHGDTFAVFDTHGDVLSDTGSEHGLYHDGTRFLSRLELTLGTRQPLLLSSTISGDNVVFAADLTNPDVIKDGHPVLPRGLLHVFRSRVLFEGGCVERLRIANHALHPIEAPIAVHFDADFADIFEVRGTPRPRRGQRVPDLPGRTRGFRYRGLDGVERRTSIQSTPAPDRTSDGSFLFRVQLEPHASTEIEIVITCEIGSETREVRHYDEALGRLKLRLVEWEARECVVTGSNESLNRWIRRSLADLRMMITETPHGPYPYAGIPWFSTPFGRDGIITALELLWAIPDVARGVLSFLAETQATTVSDVQDAQPGKILHEMRGGEMAALGEIPFGRYYGSVDATPLFVMLAAAYYRRTADRAFIDRLWPHVLAALNWMERYGDADGDGFIEYARRSPTGLVHQGWKDSHDAIFHADGSLAQAPIALCEVQGYAYAAWKGAAFLASIRGDLNTAAQWEGRADRVRDRFEREFWCDDLSTYAIALDGDKRPCRVPTSNPGHCLFTGIADPARARRVADTLMAESSFSGWGIRTVAAGASRYNPMSYHDGSVWPHDNAIVASGLSRYGFTADAARVTSAIFDLSQAVDLNRLPELICGFHRRNQDFPTLYPVACAPQAWAAGAAYLLLASCLGLQVDAVERRVTFSRAALPESVDWLRIMNLSIAGASVDLLLTRHAYDVSVTVLRREGDLEIVAMK